MCGTTMVLETVLIDNQHRTARQMTEPSPSEAILFETKYRQCHYRYVNCI